jgi:hypothetical protein
VDQIGRLLLQIVFPGEHELPHLDISDRAVENNLRGGGVGEAQPECAQCCADWDEPHCSILPPLSE